MIVAVCGNAQTIGDAFYIYRNDGMINTFFRSEIDSLAYSYFDADSTRYEEIVTQVVYTADSVYQIPLAAIDSISFVTPETTYKPGVIRLDGEVRDWIIGSDRRTVYFRSNTPKDLLPKIGDKLVTTEMSETFNGGFLGMVESKEEKPDTIALHCSEIGLEEVFEYFYYSSSNKYQSVPRMSRAGISEGSFSFTPLPFVGSFSDFLQDNIIPKDCPVIFSPQLDIVIAPSFHGRSSIIVHPLKGVVVSADITQQTTTTIDFGLSGEIGVSHDFTPGAIPLYAIAPFIYLYGELGAFIRASGSLSLEEHWANSLNYNIHFEVAYNPLISALLPIPKYKINGVESYTDHYGQCMFDGHGEVGLYGELGIELWKKDIASIGFRVEGGMMIGGNVMIYNTDDPSLFSTSTYNKLRSAEIYKKAFARIGLQGQLIGTDNVDEGLFEHEWDLGSYKLVPDFSNTTLSISDSDPHLLKASANVSGEVLFPCELGFHLFEGNNTEGIKNQHPINYYGGISSFADIYTVESLSNKYTLYPTVKLFNTFEMLATPSVEFVRGNMPIVLEVLDSDITETSAKCRAYIKGDNNSDEVFKCGIGFNEKGKGGISYCPYEDTVKTGEIYTVNIGGLEPGTTYEYFAYYELNNERICSDKKEFTTLKNDNNLEIQTLPVDKGEIESRPRINTYDDYCLKFNGKIYLQSFVADYLLHGLIYDDGYYIGFLISDNPNMENARDLNVASSNNTYSELFSYNEEDNSVSFSCDYECSIKNEKWYCQAYLCRYLYGESDLKLFGEVIEYENGIIICPDDNHPHMIDLGLPSGTKWACCNVGASVPWEEGGLYAWGESVEKEEYTQKNYSLAGLKYAENNTGLAMSFLLFDLQDPEYKKYDTASVLWGESWQMPNNDQAEELFREINIHDPVYRYWDYNRTHYSLIDYDGMVFKGPNGNYIFIPNGDHWTSTGCDYTTGTVGARNIARIFHWSWQDTYYSNADEIYNGHHVRPVAK